MRNIRIHVATALQVGTEVTLPAPAAAHVLRVLRLRAGAALTLFNGDGHDYPAHLTSASGRDAAVQIESRQAVTRESPLRITLAQAVARGEKMDWIVQKATELGVAAIVPLVTERSEVKLDDGRAAKRLEHWRAVAIAACEQSGRAIVPALHPAQPLAAWLTALAADPHSTRLVLHPGEARAPRALQPTPHSVIAVGPEGGFGDGDLAALHTAGFAKLSLGPRILRTETAGLAAIAVLQALFGDF
ncbi:MAG TPA: 16S rRNA (uracil(1498)-N(3))-methyltransferase [Rhodanobacteraceae bacterium]|nr:16S rRNA (uracil(1498)-N(3))-methyltransferase [Rhodanobacteraceae bacterium]